MWTLLLALGCGDVAEICDNGVDDDGNGRVDCDQRSCARQCDRDGDGHRSIARGGGDCDDQDAAVFPGAPEVCNGIDDDCDGLADDADVRDGPVDPVVLWLDRDGDGFGDDNAPLLRCALAPSVAEVAGDCHDRDASVFPGAPERCDGADNDCDGELSPEEQVDGDGDGDPACVDCDDSDPGRSTRSQERCSGIDDDCDGLVDEADDSVNPYTCGQYCQGPDADAARVDARYHSETWNPCVLDPTSAALCSTDPTFPDTHTQGERLHLVNWRTDEGYWRDELLLFLPPGPGRSNRTIRYWSAFAGFRVISLGFPNDDVLTTICSGPDADRCWLDARTETLYGDDVSTDVDIGPQDSIEGRLQTLLHHLAAEHPGMAFERHLSPDGSIDWTDIVVMGWSFGGAEGGFLAKHEPVRGAIMLSSPKDHREFPEVEPVGWPSLPGVTPGCALYGSWHVEEPYSVPPEDLLERAWDAMGMPPDRWDLDQDTGLPPPGTHRISQSKPTSEMPPGCDGHASVGNDACLRPEQHPAYLYLLCAAATRQFGTCAASR